ncbi:hypothetical protein OAT18_02555 [Tenacibaculum sp.]|nr:hypothetical protein [Tenacibaculum sp.]
MKLLKLKLVLLFLITISSCSNNDNLITEKDNALTQVELLEKEIEALEKKIKNLEANNNQPQLTANKKLVKKFYQEFFGDLNIQSIHNYIGDVYIQHNPYLADGKQALINGATNWFQYETPHQIDFQKVMAQDDLVFLHIKSSNGKTSTMDVFRIKDNLLVEHWDVSQDIPKNPANDHPMF